MNNKSKGGGKANRTYPISRSNRLVYIRYKDHIQCWNTDPTLIPNVNVREAVGWLSQEDNDSIMLTSDRSAEWLPFETTYENFLIIIKSDILEKREIKLAP